MEVGGVLDISRFLLWPRFIHQSATMPFYGPWFQRGPLCRESSALSSVVCAIVTSWREICRWRQIAHWTLPRLMVPASQRQTSRPIFATTLLHVSLGVSSKTLDIFCGSDGSGRLMEFLKCDKIWQKQLRETDHNYSVCAQPLPSSCICITLPRAANANPAFFLPTWGALWMKHDTQGTKFQTCTVKDCKYAKGLHGTISPWNQQQSFRIVPNNPWLLARDNGHFKLQLAESFQVFLRWRWMTLGPGYDDNGMGQWNAASLNSELSTCLGLEMVALESNTWDGAGSSMKWILARQFWAIVNSITMGSFSPFSSVAHLQLVLSNWLRAIWI